MKEVEKLLEVFVEYLQDQNCSLEYLVAQLNKMGLRLSVKSDNTRFDLRILLSYMAAFPDYEGVEGVEGIEGLHMKTAPVTVTPNFEPNNKLLFDLGETGSEGLLFCLRYAMGAAGVNRVKQCRQCSKFIFIKNSRKSYCDDRCKTAYHRRVKHGSTRT